MLSLRSAVALAAITLSACVQAATPATQPTPQPAPTTAPVASLPPVPSEAPKNWHLLDLQQDGIPGISLERARRELLANRTPQRTVVVAVIDGGTDSAHVDLRANLWVNTREVSGNNVDDDGNGYVDDVNGWNFIGGPAGENVHHDTYEVTRLHARCIGAPAAGAYGEFANHERARCPEYTQAFDSTRRSAQRQYDMYGPIAKVLTDGLPALRQAAGTDSLTPEKVQAIRSNDPLVTRARDAWLRVTRADIDPQELIDYAKGLESRLRYGLNPEYNPRGIVRDNYTNTSERRYGNRDVTGPDAEHGTHVAGIIGAVRDNGVGIDGVAPAVRLMILRTVPDGDERDKDVANAIRYAVDAGAQVINMSFGKGYSPEKAAVDEAVRYAESRGVLLVHAAGNDGKDLAREGNFPTPMYLNGQRASNWIEVGASNWKRGEELAAPFSNYGRQQVDVFAPGVDIYSTMPGGKFDTNSGTSMAAPVVSGLAALIMAYYPTLTAQEVRRIILESSQKFTTQSVTRPGSENERVPFGELSATGGIVNAYEALRMAAAARP